MQADKRWDEECGRYTLGSRASTASLEGKTAGTGCLQSPRVTAAFCACGLSRSVRLTDTWSAVQEHNRCAAPCSATCIAARAANKSIDAYVSTPYTSQTRRQTDTQTGMPEANCGGG